MEDTASASLGQYRHRIAPKVMGRKRDASRDEAILDAALEVLSHAGYVGMTMDMVAARAKAGKGALYRRWRSKAELILDAIACMKWRQVDLENLPDTGTLRGDMLALFKPQSRAEGERKVRLMAGLATLLAQEKHLAEAASSVLVDPWAAAHLALMQRALARGEIAPGRDIRAASQVIPQLAAYRALVQRKPFEKDFLVSLLDGVVLPALGLEQSPEHPKRRK